jgi:anti-sigma B factor antagonist
VISRQHGDVGVIVVRGRLDPGNPDPLEAAVRALLEKGTTKILMDLRSVSYISSTGIGSLIKAYREAHRKDGDVRLLNPSQCVRHILQISKLDGMFQVFTDERAALASYAGS